MADPWGFLDPPQPATDPWGFLSGLHGEASAAAVADAAPWEPTGSPLVQKRRRTDGSYETRPTPRTGQQLAIAAPSPEPSAQERFVAARSGGLTEDEKGQQALLAARIKNMPFATAELAGEAAMLPLRASAGMASAVQPPPGDVFPSSLMRTLNQPSGGTGAQVPNVLTGPPASLPEFSLPGLAGDVRESVREENARETARSLERSVGTSAPPALAALSYTGEASVDDLIAMGMDPFFAPGVAHGLAGAGGKAFAAAAERKGGAALASPLVRDVAQHTPEELEQLARRARLMPSVPGAEPPPFVGPGAVADALQPERRILGIGEHATEADQLQALGMRARPLDAEELARVSAGIGEPGWVPPERPADPWGFLDAPAKLSPEAKPVLLDAPSPSNNAARLVPVRAADTAVTERGTRIGFDYRLREAGDLVTSHDDALRPRPDFPQDLQPRDRSRITSEAQVSRIEKNLDPEQLGASPQAGNGAPIIGPDGVVESGNARSIALRRAYRSGGDGAVRYRSWLADNAPRFGVDPAEVAGMREPVLVRVRNTAVDRPAFAREANESAVARMSAPEQAAMDAERITPGMLDSLRIGEGGVNWQANRDFVRAFVQGSNPADLGTMFDSRGLLSAEGQRRMQNAVLAKAYGDPEAVAQLVEHADSNVRNVGNALLQQAPRFARLRAGVAAGSLHPLNISGDLGGALRKLSALRDSGVKVPDYLAQGGLFGSELSPEGRGLLAMFDANSRSAAKVSDVLGRYADQVESLGHPNQAGLFGPVEVPSKLDLLTRAAGDAQGDLFHQPAPLAAAVREIPTKPYVSRAGEPVPLFHGTGAAFDRFELHPSELPSGEAHWLSPSPEHAQIYADQAARVGGEPRVLEARLRADSIFDTVNNPEHKALYDKWVAERLAQDKSVATDGRMPEGYAQDSGFSYEPWSSERPHSGLSYPQYENNDWLGAKVREHGFDGFVSSDGNAQIGVGVFDPKDIEIIHPGRPSAAPPRLLTMEDVLPPAEEPPRSAGAPLVPTETVQPPPAELRVPTNAVQEPPPPRPTPGPAPEPPLGLTTGTKHAVTRAERLAAGLPEVERLAARESPSWEEAKALYERDPAVARDLAQEIARKPRQLTDVENDLLLHDRMHLTLDYKDALAAEDAARASGDPEVAALAVERRKGIEAAKSASDEALDKAGTLWGRAGAARQKLIAEDYSALNLNNRYRAANLGAEVPGPIRQKLADISAKLEEAQARATAAEERAQQLEASRVVAHEQKQAAKAARSGARSMSKAQLEAEYRDLGAQFRKASHVQANLSPEQVAIFTKQMKNRIQAGVTNLQDLVDTLYTDAKPYLADLEPRDVRDVIAGSGAKAQQVARRAAAGDLPRLRREARVLNALDDVRGRLADPKTAPELRAKLQAEADRWEAEAAKLGPGRGPMSDPERLAASKARAGAALADLQEQVATGNVKPRGVQRVPIAADADLINARAEVNRLRHQADRIIGAREAQNRTGFQKAMDWTAGWGRFLKLSGIATTPQKLASAAGSRALLIRPMEEIIGATESKLPLVKHFAAAAPIEGGGSTSAIAKSYGAFFGKQAREEAASILKTGEGPLDLAMGHYHDSPNTPAWMGVPGQVHGALKAPAKVAAYQYAMEKQAQWFLNRGEAAELLNPLTQETMKAKAYAYALDEIYMGDHQLVSRFNEALRPRPNQGPLATAVTSAVRTELPIVKVPVNYATDLTHYAVGIPKAAARMGRTIVRGRQALSGQTGADLGAVVRAGLDSLPPGEAEAIMRQLKKGTIGAPLLALAAAGVIKAGGYYHPGEHRRPDDLQPGEISVAGHHVPHMVLHQGALEVIQAGGSIYRQRQILDGLKDAGFGAAETVPFYEETLRLRNLRDNPTKPVGDWLKGMTIQPDVQRLARVLDQRGEHSTAEEILQQLGWLHIDANRRKPHGGTLEKLLEEEMLGIPGLRQRVR